MAYPNTIQELTGNKYSELEYRLSGPISGVFVTKAQQVLRKCDIALVPNGRLYNLQMQQAVMEFQSKVGLQPTGILNNTTWQTMLQYAAKYSDTIEGTGGETATEEAEASVSPHYDPFFDDSNRKTYRQNGKDIKIVFGNHSVVKTLKNVYMRSVNVEVDTSGNPISEVYEFVAQDVVESDELMDADKYLHPESPVDTSIQYSFGRVLKSEDSTSGRGSGFGSGSNGSGSFGGNT